MFTIHKFPLAIASYQAITMPQNACILTVQMQHDNPTLWAEVNTDHPPEERSFEVFGTGHPMDYGMGISRRYLGTVQDNNELVWHIYERTGPV